MTTKRSRRFLGIRSLIAVSAACLATLAMLPLGAHASYSVCRSDPAMVLSNGTVLDLSASIGTDISSVSNVTYVAHLPAGVRPIAVVNTDGLMGIKEHFVSYSDNAKGTYDTYTTVTTVSGSASVSADALIVALTNVGAPSVAGVSGSPIHVHIGTGLSL
jgi:hypothetical protein